MLNPITVVTTNRKSNKSAIKAFKETSFYNPNKTYQVQIRRYDGLYYYACVWEVIS